MIPLVYVLVVAGIGDLRVEHVVLVLVVVGLSAFGPRSRAFLADITPYVLVAIGYDMVRYARRAFVTAERVHACGLRDFELAAFSVAPGVTIQDWFQLHHAPFWDVLFAVPYTIFAYLALVYSGYLYFVDRARMRRYLWAFAIANFISFAVWMVFPAAPPWYIRANGCQVSMAALPSAAGLLRVDQLFGMHYYENLYSRAASVFGAMPSMHCAYPMLGLLTAWRSVSWKTRPLHVLYAVTMLVGSNYLDHHWLWDGIAGIALAAVAVWLSGKLLGKPEDAAPAVAAPAGAV
ncbi:MAG: inositol phosphorylceramide synthase [Polyangiaceae bacterium]|nr:inositol phosphorylceramide synthase [Polyangiaceae bacterium]